MMLLDATLQVLMLMMLNSEDYLKSAKHYYDCIVKPFAKHVLNAINKVVELGLRLWYNINFSWSNAY